MNKNWMNRGWKMKWRRQRRNCCKQLKKWRGRESKQILRRHRCKSRLKRLNFRLKKQLKGNKLWSKNRDRNLRRPSKRSPLPNSCTPIVLRREVSPSPLKSIMSNLHHFHKTCSQLRAISSLAYPTQMHCHLKDFSWVKKQRLQILLCKICNLDKNVSNNCSSSKWSKKNWWSFRIRWRAINPKFHKDSRK